MGQEADLPLLLQAHKLLHQVSLAPHAEGLSTELFSLAARCHQDMLELGESDRSGAIDLSIAGADLIQAHQSLGEAGKDLPDWVLVIEEQLCRYGSIWINSLLKEGSPLSQPRRERAASLLRRLQELHSEPLPWIATMLQDLQPNPANPTSDTDLRLVIVGNCQAHPIYLGLQQALPQARIHFCPSVHLADHDDVARLHRRLRDADLLVMQRVQPGYRDNIGLDSITLGSLLPPTGRSVVLPNLHYEGHHPWIGYAHDPDGRLAAVEGESPLGPYHDFLAMAAAKGGQPPEMLLDPACPMPVLDLLREQHPASLAQLQQREVECDLALSDWLDSQHRHIAVAHTINHPTQVALDQLLRRLLAHLGVPHQLGESPFNATEHLGALRIPIHPWVRQALELGPWAETWGQRNGSALPIEQQIAESISFYRRHPWIAEANAQHPKLQLAGSILARLGSTALVSNARQSNPSVAALINYFNDYDMLAWQLKSGCLDHYDRIYIWDGPYGYLRRLPLFSDEGKRLDTTPLGRRLLADPRVTYHHRHWRDEAEKRIDAYAAIQEDLVVLHDTDEFFQLDRSCLGQFWAAPHAVGAQRTQNLYAGGLRGSDAHHAADLIEALPLKRVVFRRSAITPEQHLDYCWLVGVNQKPTDETLVHPVPLWHTYHLTACRTAEGQAAKMAFYMSLALSGNGSNPIVERLSKLVEEGTLSLPEAQGIFLRGDPGFAGVPNPGFGLRLSGRLMEPSFPETILEAMLAESNKVAEGTYQLLSNYPLQLWIPANQADQHLQLQLEQPADLQLHSWHWRSGETAAKEVALRSHSSSLALELAAGPQLLGRLITITITGTGPLSELHSLQVQVELPS